MFAFISKLLFIYFNLILESFCWDVRAYEEISTVQVERTLHSIETQTCNKNVEVVPVIGDDNILNGMICFTERFTINFELKRVLKIYDYQMHC